MNKSSQNTGKEEKPSKDTGKGDKPVKAKEKPSKDAAQGDTQAKKGQRRCPSCNQYMTLHDAHLNTAAPVADPEGVQGVRIPPFFQVE